MEQDNWDDRLDRGSAGNGRVEPMVMRCQDCAFVARGMDMGSVYREAWDHQKATDHVILYRGCPQRFTPDAETRQRNDAIYVAAVQRWFKESA